MAPLTSNLGNSQVMKITWDSCAQRQASTFTRYITIQTHLATSPWDIPGISTAHQSPSPISWEVKPLLAQ